VPLAILVLDHIQLDEVFELERLRVHWVDLVKEEEIRIGA
jgi:hypothetical protein